MRTALLLLLSWLLSKTSAAAQARAAGPWRVVNQPVRYRLNTEWGEVAEGRAKPSLTAPGDTATAVRVQRKLYQVPWNVSPDSITLFFGCQNPLLAPVVSRGQLAPVRFEASGATVRLDAKRKSLLLMPSDPVVVLWAYRGQKLLFKHYFKAMSPPLPTVKCFVGGCYGKSGYEPFMRSITLRAIPDRDFAQLLPEDARYRVARFRTTLLREGKAVELALGQPAERTIQGPQGDLSDLVSISKLGDQLQTDILLVQRMNYQGIVVELPMVRRFTTDGPKCPEQE